MFRRPGDSNRLPLPNPEMPLQPSLQGGIEWQYRPLSNQMIQNQFSIAFSFPSTEFKNPYLINSGVVVRLAGGLNLPFTALARDPELVSLIVNSRIARKTLTSEDGRVNFLKTFLDSRGRTHHIDGTDIWDQQLGRLRDWCQRCANSKRKIQYSSDARMDGHRHLRLIHD